MDRSSPTYRQAALVLRLLPVVAKCDAFALKGGTAINFFLRDMPRLSVDIDLACVRRIPWKDAMDDIRQGLEEIAQNTGYIDPGIRVEADTRRKLRLTAVLKGCRVKIELSPVMRGAVWPVETRDVVETVGESLGYSRNPVLSFNDLYAGKICAALDRKHPRDLFDIALLLEREGIGRNLLRTFLVYLICHNRPMAELLDPGALALTGLKALYDNELRHLARIDMPFDKIIYAFERLVNDLHSALADRDRRFLLSVKAGTPDWRDIDLDGVADLPAVKWKMKNLKRMDKDKHRAALAKLRRVLDDGPRRTITPGGRG